MTILSRLCQLCGHNNRSTLANQHKVLSIGLPLSDIRAGAGIVVNADKQQNQYGFIAKDYVTLFV